MSAQSPYGTSSWAFWPVGDRYSLTPKFAEKYADTDSTVRPQDEKNRLNLVGDWGASEVSFTMQLRDMKDPKNPAVPSEEPEIFARVEKVGGWIDQRSLAYTLVQETPEPTDEFPNPVPEWNGDIEFVLGDEVRAWIGHSSSAYIVVDAEFPTDAPQRIRVGYGSLVLRR